MAFPGICIRNYTLLLRAAERGELALMECTDRVTCAPVYAVCDIWREGSVQGVTPLAQLHAGNSADLLWPPGLRPTVN
jgi:hypothetical protein